MISILKSPWSLLCLGPFCPLVPFGHGPFCPLVPFGHGPFWVLVPFGWSLLAGPFWPVPYGLVPFDPQSLHKHRCVLLTCPAYTYMHLENTLMITYQLTSTNRQMKTLVALPTTG